MITLEYRVPYADTDQMGYVYYANYLVYFERGRNELMRSIGFTYKKLEEIGFGLPVMEAYAKYHSPAKYDDLLTICAEVTEFHRLHLVVSCKVMRDGVVLAEGYTKHAFIDMKTGRPARIPEEIRSILDPQSTQNTQK